jgi:hypothetical protein
MKYEKPEVNVLGDATEVIEVLSNGKHNSSIDSPSAGAPAYDLDE